MSHLEEMTAAFVAVTEEQLRAAWNKGYDEGSREAIHVLTDYDGNGLVTAILRDLISELRDGHPRYGDRPPLWIRKAVDHAEERLKKVLNHG